MNERDHRLARGPGGGWTNGRISDLPFASCHGQIRAKLRRDATRRIRTANDSREL
jgi:hypothetical protein